MEHFDTVQHVFALLSQQISPDGAAATQNTILGRMCGKMDLVNTVVAMLPPEINRVLLTPWIDKPLLIRSLMPRSMFSTHEEAQRMC